MKSNELRIYIDPAIIQPTGTKKNSKCLSCGRRGKEVRLQDGKCKSCWLWS